MDDQLTNKPNAANPPDPTKVVGFSAYYESFTGPYPPPDLLFRYNEVLPNAAERIFKMTEAQAKHRQSLELKEFEAMVEVAKAEAI